MFTNFLPSLFILMKLKQLRKKYKKKTFIISKFISKICFQIFCLVQNPKMLRLCWEMLRKFADWWIWQCSAQKKSVYPYSYSFVFKWMCCCSFFFFVLNYFNTENMLQIYCRKLYDWLLKTVYNVKKKDLYRFFVSLAINWYWKKANF